MTLAPGIHAVGRDLSWTELVMSVFIHSHDGIIITDRQGQIVEVNDAFCTLTGYSRDEVIGKNPRFLQSGIHDPEFYSAMWQDLLENGIWRGEIANRLKDGRTVVEILTISALHGSDGLPAAYIGTFVDITTIKEQQQALEQLAYFDALTGLPNRLILMDRLQQILAEVKHTGRPVAVCHLGLDGHRAISETQGRQVLLEVARRLEAAVGKSDTVARLDGDEFALLLAEPNTVDNVGGALERILGIVAQPLGSPPTGAVSASIGVTLFPTDRGDAETLLHHAEQAMSRARKAGRNKYRLYDAGSERRLYARQQLLADISTALATDELELHFQPKVSLGMRRVVGFEALLRWRHPTDGYLLPERFWAALDDPSTAARIDFWVLRRALRQMSDWLAAGQRIAVSVNVSAHLLRQPDLAQTLARLFDEHPELALDLELEILETTLLDDLPHLGRQIKACREQGIGFTIDDFGTGYSCLTWLKWIPVQVLKIDRSFVAGIVNQENDRAIVSNVLRLARDLKCQVVAEGAETAAHIRLLAELGCDVVQGFGIAHPMPAAEVKDWLTRFVFDEEWLPPESRPGQAPLAPCAPAATGIREE